MAPRGTRSRGGQPKGRPAGSRLGRNLLLLGTLGLLVWVAFELHSLPSSAEIAALARTPVHDTAVMRARRAEAAEKGRKLRVVQQWVELSRVSQNLSAAIVASEDARFFSHGGIDLKEIHEAVYDRFAEGKRLRGASTLTQQVVKNLYLSEDRSLLRKLKEAVLAWRLESELSKRRILTLYVNIVELGEGVFGVEAASRAWFRKSAAQLSLAEAAALAAMLPNPHRISPAHPALLGRRAQHVVDRVEEEHLTTREQAEAARTELEAWLGAAQAER